MTAMVTDKTFEAEVIASKEPVVVDFFAEWCGPCKAMAPALDLVAKEMAGKVKVVKVDVDQCPEITQKYRIQAMPTLDGVQGRQGRLHPGRCTGAESQARGLDQERDLSGPRSWFRIVRGLRQAPGPLCMCARLGA